MIPVHFILDGPEKAGKTTMLATVRSILESEWGMKVAVRHWVGMADPDHTIYLDALYAERTRISTNHNQRPTVYLWDRAWPSESVYGTLLREDRLLRSAPVLGEWYHSMYARTCGELAMLLPASDKLALNANLRTPDDINVDPVRESALYFDYAMQYRWKIYYQDYTANGAQETAQKIAKVIRNKYTSMVDYLPSILYSGRPAAKIVAVLPVMFYNDWRSTVSHPEVQAFLNKFFNWELEHLAVGTVRRFSPGFLTGKTVITFGMEAQKWARWNGDTTMILPLPEPASVFGKGKKAAGYNQLLDDYMYEIHSYLDGIH